ncbi:hypothetical protein OXPF_42550 [Oxobacter pfennigii]|uniref:DUF3885 domain-containing protein n=1 Tax=Oxobacter pfennigii TaxID=36849 RepID=A0A0P8W1T7_9CLOT|nr:hypothetical protein [Oxobacter pfennigii]KPU42470.1 hypothetical protein OXPF_42550 [Oxobacter pfennigii]
MKLKRQLQIILNKHNGYEGILSQLTSPYALYQKLSPGSPYRSEDMGGGVNPEYTESCVQIAVKLYESIAFKEDLIVVYEDRYSEGNLEEVAFVESCLISREASELATFLWKCRPEEGDCTAAGDLKEGNYTCTRRLYGVKGIDTKRLFREIIMSDIGGSYELASKVFIIDMESACIFHLYDDRGAVISAPEGNILSGIGTEHDDVPEAEYIFSVHSGHFHWLKADGDDPEDLCLHGLVSVGIGAEKFSYPCTVSAAALQMLKTLTENHEPTYFGGKMLPCCGHTLYANDKLDEVDITGCENGIDWAVRHEGERIRLITASGRETLVGFVLYRRVICKFADAVEYFYKKASPKQIPQENGLDRDGYMAFWQEWHRRR